MREHPKHMIWSNYYFDPDDFEVEEVYGDELDEDARWRLAAYINAEYLEDERVNLDINVPEGIIAIADLGLWFGRRTGYKEVGYNINECLSSDTDYATWYVDDLGDLACEAVHHDGTNHYIYRAWKPGVTYDQADALLNKIYYGTATRKDITKLTRRLGDDIAEVYGWNIRGHKYGYSSAHTRLVAVGA